MQASRATGEPVSRAGLLGWVLFDWACQPWFTLVTTFVFAPYFATRLAASPAEGQALWGYATAAAGLAIAALSPFLGAAADRMGRQKPWTAAAGVVLVLAALSLLLARPGEPHAVSLALAAFAVGTVGAEIAAVFNNAMMPRLVPSQALGRLSGWGWACGYLGGLSSLVLAFGFLVADAKTGRTAFGLAAPFQPGPAPVDTARLVGPLTALWFLIFSAPLFLFTPDGRPAEPLAIALAGARQDLGHLWRVLRARPEAARFLVANMLYTDGLVGVFAFGAIYAAGMLGWSATELGLFGIFLTVTGTAGAILGGVLDDRFGAKRVAAGALVLLTLACALVISVDRDSVLFVVEVAPRAAGGGIFSSVSDIVFLLLGGLIGAAAGPLQASSRTLLARLAPPDHIGEFFGLFALSGKVTSFMGPLAVAVATDIAKDQRAGISVLAFFLLAGLAVLRTVKMR